VSGWDRLLTHVSPHDHMVQFYDKDEQLLAAKVAGYLYEGWKSGDALLVVGEAERNAAIREHLRVLGVDTAAEIHEGGLVFFDAEEMVNRILAPGQPEWGRFDALVGATVREMRARHLGLRAYGEMVGILWRRGQYAAAERIEDFWNRLMKSACISLFCAYPIDVLGEGFDMQALDRIFAAHTHVLPTGPDGELGLAIDRAMEDILGEGAGGLRKVIHTYFRPAWAAVPAPEGVVLWLRSNLPQYAERILGRARQYYTS
jgi:hypothetical protein